MPLGLVLFEPVRSAEPPIISGTAAASASSAPSDAMRVPISFGVAASFSFTERTAAASLSFGSLPLMRRSNSTRRSAGSAARRSFQAWCADLPRKPGAAPELEHIRRHDEGGLGPAELVARALDLVGAERRAVALLGAGLARRAEADDGAAGDQRWPIRASVPARWPLAMASGSCPSMRVAAQPAASKRFT